MSKNSESATKDLVHIDIYAIVESTQELHFGNVRDLNVNRVELISVPKDGAIIQKPYMSPTKVRGVARRALLWELARLGDKKVISCGIPATCGVCDLCKLYGALVTTQKGGKPRQSDTKTQNAKDMKTNEQDSSPDNDITKTETQNVKETETEGSVASRVIQAGGVAIQELSPTIKQRLSSPCYIINGRIGQYNAEEIKKLLRARGITGNALDRLSQPLPYEKEYVTGLFPIYWHAYYLEKVKGSGSKMSEPQMVAFSFIEALKRVGAGHPKGAEIKEGKISGNTQPLVVVDIYTKPLGKRPIISISESDEKTALETFAKKALVVDGTNTDDKANKTNHITIKDKDGFFVFERFIGDDAESFLRELASGLETSSEILKPKQ
jgi:hypothetical protein